MGTQTFGKHERVRKRKEFQAAYEKGARFSSDNFIVFVHNNQSGTKRLGVTVTKKVGNSVKRNRAKRLLREFFRLNKDKIPESRDVIIIAKKDISSLKYQDVTAELERLFAKT